MSERVSTTFFDMHELLLDIIRRAREALPFDSGSVLLFDPATQMLAPRVHLGSRSGNYRPIPLGEGIVGQVAQRQEAELIGDLRTDPRGTASDPASQSELAVPVVLDGELLGVFNVESHEPDAYNAFHLMILQTLADQAALVIRAARLYSELAVTYDDLSALLDGAEIAAAAHTPEEMLRQVLYLACQTLNANAGLFLLYDAAADALVPASETFGLSGAVSDLALPAHTPDNRLAAVLAGRTAIIHDPAHVPGPTETMMRGLGLRNVLAAPLRIQETVLGIFVVGNRQGPFTQPDARLLAAMGSHVAAALHHAQLLDVMRTRLREADALERLAAITSETINLDEMLTDALRVTAELLDCEGAQLWMPDHIAYALRLHEPSALGIARDWETTAWALNGPGYLVDVYHTGHPYVSHAPPPDAEPGCRNVLACPLNTRSRTLGVLHLINRRAGTFYDAQIEISQTLANQIAVSLGSAQTFAAERRRAELLNQISRASQELYATLDTETLLRKTARSIYDVFGHDAVYVLLLDDDHQTVRVRASATRSPLIQMPGEVVFPVSQGVVGRAIRTAQTQVIPDVRSDPDFLAADEEHRTLQSALVVPLRQSEQTIGAIEILSTQLNAFRELEGDALETLAIQVSIALENARLYAQSQRRLMEQTIVHQIGQDLTAILAYAELVPVMAQHMNRALNTSGCMVGLYEPRYAGVHVEADYRAPYHHNKLSPSLSGELLLLSTHYAIGEAIRTRRPITVYSSDPHVHPEARALLDHLGDQSQLILPMIAGDRVIGVVDWTDHEPRLFTEDDIRLAQTLVVQATIAIDNALLFRQLEKRALELAEANRLKSQFLATISHELRTPMNSIIGFSETLLSSLYGELNELQASRIERIRRNGYNLLALIDDLLDLSKIDAGRMQLSLDSVSIQDVIHAVAQGMEAQAAAQGLELAIQVPDHLPPVRADAQRLQQIITNLLGNAIKFTTEGGVTVSSETVRREGRSMVQTTVADTGIGISEADQQVIFDEFRQADGSATRAYGGTGLGLAITKKLVEMMDGTVWVESKVNQGSRFSFVLPATK